MDKNDILYRLAQSIDALGVRRVYLDRPVIEFLKREMNVGENKTPEINVSKSEILNEEQVKVEDCRGCGLYKTRTKAVYADGGINANLMFVGEAPGADEDKSGIPFVGRAGKLLDRILEEVGLNRSEVYICNTLKCRPPGNRDPLPEESAACSPFLHKQIEVIDPKIIVTLGLPAIRYFVPGNEAMGKLRAKIVDYKNRKILPTYHPAAALRFPAYKEQIYDDIVKARDIMIKDGLL
jgi:DNA polymerase